MSEKFTNELGKEAYANFLKWEEFEKELTQLINKYSRENLSDTPDFLLAHYLINCLRAYERVTADREKWVK